MEILIVCSAGASSSFLAHRLRRYCAAAGTTAHITVGVLDTLPEVRRADVILAGVHLRPWSGALAVQAWRLNARLAFLPDQPVAGLDGATLHALARDALTPPPADTAVTPLSPSSKDLP